MVMVMRSKNSSTTCGGCSSGVIFWGYWRCVGFLKLSIIYLQAIVATVRLTGCNGLGKIPNLCLLVAKLQMVGKQRIQKTSIKMAIPETVAGQHITILRELHSLENFSEFWDEEIGRCFFRSEFAFHKSNGNPSYPHGNPWIFTSCCSIKVTSWWPFLRRKIGWSNRSQHHFWIPPEN